MNSDEERVITMVPTRRFRPALQPYTLTVRMGPAKGYEVQLSEGRLVIGRDPSADICIDDVHISRRQVEIEVLGGAQGLRVRDLGSKNGTYLGNCRIVDAIVVEHALMSLGDDTVIELSIEQSELTGWPRDRLAAPTDRRLRATERKIDEPAEPELRSEIPTIEGQPGDDEPAAS